MLGLMLVEEGGRLRVFPPETVNCTFRTVQKTRAIKYSVIASCLHCVGKEYMAQPYKVVTAITT